MPYTLKTNQISVKDPETGEYSGVDILAEQTEQGLIAELQAEGTTQVNRINQAAVDVQSAVDKAETDAAKIISDTQTSVNTLEAQKNTIAQTVASMAELGTDTTLSTPGMAADAGAVGDLKSAITQIAVFSKNILPKTEKTATVMGISVNYNDGVVTMSGTSTGSGGRLTPITDSFVLGAGTYTITTYNRPYIQMFLESGSTIIAQLNNETIKTFTLEQETTCYLGLNMASTDSFDNRVFKVQIEKGSESSVFENPSWSTAIDNRQDIVSPEMFGAIGDGVAFDGDAVQAALNSGKIVVANGVYNIYRNAADDQYAYINIPDGATLIGGTYKFPDNGSASVGIATGINAFIGNHFTILDCTFDMNGYNNIPTPTKTMYAIFVDNCDGIIIRGCNFKDSAGRDYIFVKQGSNFRLEDCTFKNGGTNIEGSDATKQNDFSYVYTSADESIITRCLIDVPDDDPFTYCGGFELHGNNSILENCIINNCLPAVYIAKHQVGDDPNYNVKVLNNTILNCQGGVSCFANHTLDNIKVSGNYITLKPITPVAEGMYGIGASRNTQSNFKAVGNTIIQAEASTNGCSGISLGHTTGAEVTFNILKNIPYPIYIYGNDANSDVVIERNLIVSSADIANYAITRQNTSAEITKLTVFENEVQKYAGLLNSISSVSDYLVLDRILDMKYLIEPSKNLCPVAEQDTTVLGVSVNYKNGHIALSGTGTGSGGRLTPICPSFTLNAGTYTWKTIANLGMQIFIESGNTIISQMNTSTSAPVSATFTLTEQTTVYIGVNVGTDTYDHKIDVELESGESAGIFLPSGAYTAIDAIARASLS